jgi:hypothetical protein
MNCADYLQTTNPHSSREMDSRTIGGMVRTNLDSTPNVPLRLAPRNSFQDSTVQLVDILPEREGLNVPEQLISVFRTNALPSFLDERGVSLQR